MRFRRRLIVALCILAPSLAVAADWRQFRGPGGLGNAAQEKGLPTQWDDTTNIAWKAELPGPGSSSPVVVGDRVLVTCYSGYGLGKKGGDVKDLRRQLLCFDRAGKPLWKKVIAADAADYAYASYQALHGYASGTPVSDGKNVYVFFGVAGVFAFDLDGNQLWRTSVGTGTSDWGSGTSPVLWKDHVIVNASVESGSLVALTKEGGKPVWTAKGMSASWNTPIVVEVGGRAEVIVSVRGKLRAFDPDKGKELWTCEGINDYVVPSIVVHGDLLCVLGGRTGVAKQTAKGYRLGKDGADRIWQNSKGSNVSSPVYHDGHFYWAGDSNGTVYCAKANDGTLVYEKKLQPNCGRIYASATAGDGKIYYVSREDGIYVVAASPTYALVAHNQFKSDRSIFNASPAIADGQLYLRSDRVLYCIGKGKKLT